MHRFLRALPLGILAFSVVSSVGAETSQNKPKAADTRYQVLNPWAEVDPVPARPISPRIQTPAGKKIGLFANFKRAAHPIAVSMEKRLKAMYPDIQTSIFDSRLPNVNEAEAKDPQKFAAWAKGLDAAILVVGD